MNKNLKKILSVTLLSAFLISVSACAGGGEGTTGSGSEAAGSSTASGSSGDVIKFGVFEPMTGANASGGQLDVKGIKLAQKLYPEVLGKKIELVIADNKSDKVEAANAVSKLIDKDKVDCIIGSWGSSFCMAAGDSIKNAKIPAVAASATNPLVTKDNEFYSRVAFIDPFQGTVMANYAYNNVKAKKVAIIQEVSNDYSIGLSKFFQDQFTKLSGDKANILEVSNYNTGDQDFSAQLTSIKAKNPDAIFAPGNYTESALICKQARELGITCPIMGGDTWEMDEFLEIGGEGVEGIVFSTFFDKDNPLTDESKKFLDAWEAEYPGEEPAATAVLAYDAYVLLVDAMTRAGSTDKQKVNDEVRATNGFEGAGGVVTMDENGDAIKDAVIKEVKDGKFKYLDTIKAE